MRRSTGRAWRPSHDREELLFLPVLHYQGAYREGIREELRRLTAEAGIRLSFLSEYAAVPDPRFAHTLVINYAGLSQSDLEEALQLLTDVLLPLLA